MTKLQGKVARGYGRCHGDRFRHGNALRRRRRFRLPNGRRQKELDEAVKGNRQQRRRRSRGRLKTARPRSALRDREGEGKD
jgi:hypothetical protein